MSKSYNIHGLVEVRILRESLRRYYESHELITKKHRRGEKISRRFLLFKIAGILGLYG